MNLGFYRNTLKLIYKVPFNYLCYHLNYVWTLPLSLTFSVTYKCNFRCKTCNIWKDSNGENELDLLQIDKIFHSLGNSLYWITLDGGEPFLRKDLAEICKVIYRNCKPAIINIPSNGSLSEETISSVEKILKLCPDTVLIINLSLDHIGDKHDEIRGAKGAFSRLLNTYDGLKDIKSSFLRVGVNTVISNYNIKDWELICSFVKKIQPDSHIFEIAQLRDEFRNKNLNNIVPEEQSALSLLKQLSKLINIANNTVIGKCLKIIRKYYYSLIEKNIIRKRQNIPCFAGIASAYISPYGKVWTCSNNEWLMGDLREYSFNLKQLWIAKAARDERKSIKSNKCFCLQVNTNYINLLHSPLYLGKLSYDCCFGDRRGF